MFPEFRKLPERYFLCFRNSGISILLRTVFNEIGAVGKHFPPEFRKRTEKIFFSFRNSGNYRKNIYLFYRNSGNYQNYIFLCARNSDDFFFKYFQYFSIFSTLPQAPNDIKNMFFGKIVHGATCFDQNKIQKTFVLKKKT